MAKTRCPPRYKNLGLETFGNKKKVTEEMLKQFCKNDEWLRQNLEEVRYLTPPAVRKSLILSETIDMEKSWGCMVSKDNRVQFSNKTFDSFGVDFSDETNFNKWVDTVSSTTKTKDFGDGTAVCLDSTLEKIQEMEIKYGGTAEITNGYNSAWYVGFDKSQNYYLKPKWIKDWKSVNDTNESIPAIARAQTFKVEEEGDLISVDLALEYNGVPTLSSSPLYVQIWDTYETWITQTKWDRKKKKAVPEFETISQHAQAHNNTNPPNDWQRYKKVTEKIKYTSGKNKDKVKETRVSYVKDNNGNYVLKRRKVAKPNAQGGKKINKPLAEAIYNPTSTTKGGEPNITFDNPVRVYPNRSYALVLLSPLNSWDNCPRWAGWGRNCKNDGLYSDGYAFYSSDNGKSWKIYGKSMDEEITEYKQGKYSPQDYRFRTHVRTKPELFEEHYEAESELYLKPIYSNPIWKVQIHPNEKGTILNNTNLSIKYYLSTDGDNWNEFEKDTTNVLTVELANPSRVVFVKAVLSSTDQLNTPYLKNLDVDLFMNLPTEMYARTKPYTPEKFGTILGASVWGRVFAPYTLEDSSKVDCKVDIIEMKENTESFDIIHIMLLEEKINERLIPDMEWIDDCDSDDSICRYLTNHPEVLDVLKEYKIYILPYEMNDGMHNLSFARSNDELIVQPLDIVNVTIDENNVESISYNYPDNIGGIQLTHEVAYPVISCQLEPEGSLGHGNVSSFGEWYDYIFDYETNELIFKRDTLNRMANGDLVIKYNPVFIKDLTNDEIGIHYDEDGNRTDGLILDYFKERIKITNDELEDNRVKLKVEALDPIRQVYLYSDDNDEPISLIEDSDYYYDIYTHELVFTLLSKVNNTSILREDDILEVVYTPKLEDTSICIGYNAVRTTTDVDCYIDDYYIEYKV